MFRSYPDFLTGNDHDLILSQTRFIKEAIICEKLKCLEVELNWHSKLILCINTCLIFHVNIISTRTKIIHILRIILKGLCTIQCIFASFIAFVHINMHKATFFLKYIYKNSIIRPFILKSIPSTDLCHWIIWMLTEIPGLKITKH